MGLWGRVAGELEGGGVLGKSLVVLEGVGFVDEWREGVAGIEPRPMSINIKQKHKSLSISRTHALQYPKPKAALKLPILIPYTKLHKHPPLISQAHTKSQSSNTYLP